MAAVCVVGLLACSPAPAPPVEDGLVVERVDPDGGGARAGLEARDVLTAWRLAERGTGRPLAEGRLRSALDVTKLRDEQMPRGELTLEGFRGPGPRAWTLPRTAPLVEVSPSMPPALHRRYLDIRAVARGDEKEPRLDAARALEGLAKDAADGHPALASFFHDRAADVRYRSGAWLDAIESYAAAAAAARSAGLPWDEARHLYHQANTLSRRLDRPEEAYALLDRVDELWREHGMNELAAAGALTLRGEIARRRGELEKAAVNLESALEIKRRLAPKSLTTARTLSILGKVEATRGRFGEAEQLLVQALALRRRLDPGSVAVAHSQSALGTVRLLRGDLAGAEENLLESLALFERAEATDSVIVMLGNLGTLATQRGDFLAAEAHYERALALAEVDGAGTLDFAAVLHNLAGLASRRGNLERAVRLIGRALEIRRQRAPGSLDLAVSLDLLAQLEMKQGDSASASRHLAEALEIEGAVAPGGLGEARAAHNLAWVEVERGELDSARRRLRSAEALLLEVGSQVFELGRLWTTFGELEFRAGRFGPAEQRFRRAVAHLELVAPGTDLETDARWGLARLLDATDRPAQALEAYRQAEEALDRQQGRLGGGQEIEARFRARYREMNRRRVELELEAGRVGAAFEALESFRARVLRHLLSERDLVFADLPPALDAERRRAATGLDRALAELSTGEDVGESQRSLEEARRQLRLIREKVRLAAPRFALTGPRPLGRDEALAALDPGTVALVYGLGESSGTLFVLEHGEIRALRIAAGEEELARMVERFRLLMRSSRLDSTRVELSRLARELYELLVDPAGPAVERAERLLIVPDGPLHLLPFAALEDPGKTGPERYLGVARPLHAATSLAVYAELERRRGAAHAGVGQAAFADPGPRSRPAATVRGRDGFSPLPASRGEAWAIKRRFPETEIFLGRSATEDRAREILAEAEVVHFAVHGFLDERYPLSSGLVLAEGGGGNGLLQAWEIFEGVRTRADLVALSGCETAIDAEVAGEGLLGLTRAFQWAGARSVLASLWRISDRGTAALMDRLYHHLAAGRPVAVALQRARGDLLAGAVVPPAEPGGLAQRISRSLGLTPPAEPEDFSHPVYWAGFRLDGDWR